jgi:hypothetical protein
VSATVTARSALTDRRFWLHFLAMLLAMAVGMAVGMVPLMLTAPLSPVLRLLEVQTLLMATAMAIGMAAWMWFRAHSRTAIVEMCAAMYLAFVVLFPPYWLGWMSAAAVFTAGHLLMLPVMVLAMLRRPGEYVGPSGN